MSCLAGQQLEEAVGHEKMSSDKEPGAGSENRRAAASAVLPVSPVEDDQVQMVCGPEVGDIYSVGTDFCFRMPDLRRLDEEVDELMGSDVPTIWRTCPCTSEKKSVQEAAASVALHVKPVTAEVTLKHSSFSLESRGRQKRKSREH